MASISDRALRLSRAWVIERKNDILLLANYCEQLVLENEALRDHLASAVDEAEHLRVELAQSQLISADCEPGCSRLRPLTAGHLGESPVVAVPLLAVKREADTHWPQNDCVDAPVVTNEHLENADAGVSAITSSTDEDISAAGISPGEEHEMKPSSLDIYANCASSSTPCIVSASSSRAKCALGSTIEPRMDTLQHVRRKDFRLGRRTPHICPACGKPFGSPAEILRHSVVHTGERPFVCELCGRGFQRKNQLVGHRTRNQCPADGGGITPR